MFLLLFTDLKAQLINSAEIIKEVKKKSKRSFALIILKEYTRWIRRRMY